MAHYEIWLQDSNGNTIDIIDEWQNLVYTRSTNSVSSLHLIIDGNYDISKLRLDGRLLVMRSIGGGRIYVDTETVWLIRKIEKELHESGRKRVKIEAFCAIELLSRRIVAFNSGTAQADKSGAADDIMKEIVSDNFGSGAGDGRDLSNFLSIQEDSSAGPTISKEISRKNVLEVLQAIASSTHKDGPPIYFDIVTLVDTTFEFRTFSNQRGTDRSHGGGNKPVILSPDRGSLSNLVRTFDYISEFNYVYAGGAGIGGDRLIATASSFEHINNSPLNRRESLYNSNTSTQAYLQSEANGQLRFGRPQRTFVGEVLDIPGNRYGLHWKWGDKVTAEFDNETVDCTIDSVQVKVQDGQDFIDVKLRGEEN